MSIPALYFLLAGSMQRFAYLKLGLAVVLVFVGAKMLIADLYHVPIGISLGAIALILTVAIVASVRRRRGEEAGETRPAPTRTDTVERVE